MRQFIAFTKKELYESMATYRLYVLLAVFVIFGVMSPLIAKLTPDIIASMGDLGIEITLPEPTAMDSWEQFFKNVGQMGMLTLIITFCGIMANEFSRGTLINLLTKGMKRHTVILSKFLSASVMWAAGYMLCLAICYAYTAYFWPGGELSNVFLAFLSLWLFGEFLITLLIFGGVLFGNFYGSLLICGGVIVVLNLLNIIPKVQKYNPVILSGDTLNLLNERRGAADFIPAALVCAAAAVLLIIAAIAVFNKKRV